MCLSVSVNSNLDILLKSGGGWQSPSAPLPECLLCARHYGRHLSLNYSIMLPEIECSLCLYSNWLTEWIQVIYIYNQTSPFGLQKDSLDVAGAQAETAKIKKRTHQSQCAKWIKQQTEMLKIFFSAWERYLLATLSDKGLVPKLYKEFINTKSR